MFYPIRGFSILGFPVVARHPKTTCSFIPPGDQLPRAPGATAESEWQRYLMGRLVCLTVISRFGCWWRERPWQRRLLAEEQSCVINGSTKPHTNKISYSGAEAVPETSWKYLLHYCCCRTQSLAPASRESTQTRSSMPLQISLVAFEIFQALQTTLRWLERRLAQRDSRAYVKKK